MNMSSLIAMNQISRCLQNRQNHSLQDIRGCICNFSLLSVRSLKKAQIAVLHAAFVLILLTSLVVTSFGQEKGQRVKTVLDSLSTSSVPQLQNKVDISFSNISIKELVRTIANATDLNVSIDPSANLTLNANFNKVNASDVIVYLCSQYNLELTLHGSILFLKPSVIKEEKLAIDLTNDSLISLDVNKIRLSEFFKELTNKTGNNFIISPDVGEKTIHVYTKNAPLKNALLQLSGENGLEIKSRDKNLYLVFPSVGKTSSLAEEPKLKKENKFLFKYQDERVDADISDAPLRDVLFALSRQTGYSVEMLSQIDSRTNISTKQTSLEEFLNSLFYGSENTYRISENTLFVGSRKLPGIKSCELIKLNNRSVDSLIRVLPTPITQDLTIKEYGEQNSFVVWGDADLISNFRKTIFKIDVVVPVILIDVIIVDAGKNFSIDTGIETGLGDSPATTSGTINPGLNFTMGAQSVNNMLSRIGLTNLGKVSPNFYLKLKAMETDGILEIRSTPQLSTMNGHAARMSIGQTQYYKEELTNIIGSQNPQTQMQSQYKPVEAKMAVNIKPFVTGNGLVSMTIEVEQSQFTDRISTYAPPGIVSRKFSSMIRVRNQETILLGGLEEDTDSKNTKGWPLLSKIPVIKWLFSSKSDSMQRKHLNIFIKPTVFY